MKSTLKIPAILFLCYVGTATAEILGRGASCETRKVNPKFRATEDSCDESKGLFCMESENPDFTPKGQSSKICDCTEEYYFDSVSKECRIQIGLQCDPDKASNDEWDLPDAWKNKCPSNGYCSTNLGRYGPKGARGMCRCNDGLVISSVWFVGGGGSICEEDSKGDSVDKEEMSPAPDYPENGNTLTDS